MNEESDRKVVRGLKDVAAAETRISYVDPKGYLYYLGYNIDDLVGRVTYTEVAYLLIHKRLPNRQELDEFCTDLVSEMKLPNAMVRCIWDTPGHVHPMDVLRTEVSRLGEYDVEKNDLSEAANLRRATRLIAQVPTIVATLHRSRIGQPVPVPRKDFGFAENFLNMFKG